MPLVKITSGGSDAESLAKPAPGNLTGDLGRQTTNLALAQHIGNFIAGQVASQFQNENLADLMKGRNMVMISGSWG